MELSQGLGGLREDDEAADQQAAATYRASIKGQPQF